IDYTILIAEDNDGGHELELGEISLSSTYIAKRDYSSVSIENDLEYEKFDAMIAKLFEIMDRKNHLFEWDNTHSFTRAIQKISDQISGRENTKSKEEIEDDSIRGKTRFIYDDIPSKWEVTRDNIEIDLADSSVNLLHNPDISASSLIKRNIHYAFRYRRNLGDNCNISIQASITGEELNYRVEIALGKLPKGRVINKTMDTFTQLKQAYECSIDIIELFDKGYENFGDPEEAMEFAVSELDY
ncbi:hypothetical protein C435_15458, partial [Haloarcula marismortui ATCC 33799]